MAAPKYQSILSRLDSLQDAGKAGVDEARLLDDADDLVEELLLAAARQVDLERLSKLLDERRALDFDALRIAAAIFTAMKLDGPVRITDALTVDPEEHLRGLKEDIARLEAMLINDPTSTGGLALDMIIGGKLLRLTMCAIERHRPLNDLVALARQKVDLLKAPQIALLWSYVQREFDHDRDVKMEQANNILPMNFLQFEDEMRARDKLARYIVDWKPRLMLALHHRNGAGFPIDVPNLSSVLAWKSSETAVGVPIQEVRLAKVIQRIVALAAQLFNRTPEEIAAALSIDPMSALVRSLRLKADAGVASMASLSYEIRKGAQLLSELSLKDLDFAECVRRYKLGIEVMAPEINASFKQKSEIQLQKELARFALEHGFFVVGTKFGRSESDLVSWEKEALHIVETKLFRTAAHATPTAITKALAQLSSYMDQHPTTPFGILVIYNLSTVQISAPARWIRQRFLVISVNLLPGSPSERTHVLEIVEADDNSIIKVLKVRQLTVKKKAKKEKGARRK